METSKFRSHRLRPKWICPPHPSLPLYAAAVQVNSPIYAPCAQDIQRRVSTILATTSRANREGYARSSACLPAMSQPKADIVVRPQFSAYTYSPALLIKINSGSEPSLNLLTSRGVRGYEVKSILYLSYK